MKIQVIGKSNIRAKKNRDLPMRSFNNLELTYFPGFDPSIISGAGLNFSVRDGKR